MFKGGRRWTAGTALVVMTIAAILSAADDNNPPAAVYVDDSPTVQDQLRQAMHLREQGRLADASVAYQKIIEQHSGTLTQVDDRRYTDTWQAIRARMLADADLLRTYRQLHEAPARRLLDHAGSQEELQAVAQRYNLCESGLLAGMRLAADALESGRPDDAAGSLDALKQHPDLKGESLERWHKLQALAGLYDEDGARLDLHRGQLEQLQAQESLAELKRWQAALRMPGRDDAVDGLLPVPAGELPQQPLGEPVEYVLANPPPARPAVRDFQEAIRPNAQAVTTLPMLAAVHGDRAFINDGTSVVALDRSSLHPEWTFQLETEDIRRQRTQPLWDYRMVAVHGRQVVAVLGRSHGSSRNMMPSRNGENDYLVCLDRNTGELRWKLTPGELDPSLATTFMQGMLRVSQGRAYVLLRRRQASGFHDAYLVSVDLARGKMLWKRYLSSISGSPYGSISMADMSISGGMLYVADNLGSVSAIDSRTGLVKWLLTIPTTEDAGLRRAARGVQVTLADPSQPVLVAAGLVVGPRDETTPALLLDPQTGQIRRELGDAVWQSSSYLMPVGSDVLAVGEDIVRFDGKTLEPKWTHSTGQSRGPVARVCVSDRHVLVPLPERIRVLDASTGKQEAQLEPASAGNVLLLDGQLLLTTAKGLQSYVALGRVYQVLRQAMTDRPADPAPGLSLAHVATKSLESTSDATLAKRALLEGVDHAVQAMLRLRQSPGPAAEASQGMVFDAVLDLSQPRRVRDAALRGMIFERLASLSALPRQEVAYRLAQAAWLVEVDQAERAVEHYQDVLGDPSLASQPYMDGERSTQAGIEARARLEQLIRSKGQEVYAKYDAIALRRLEQLRSGPVAEVDALRELADQYPLALAAVEARLDAAEHLNKRGEITNAIAELRQAWSQDVGKRLGTRQRTLGRLVELYAQSGKPHRARQWLQRARRENAAMMPLRSGQPVAIDAWLGDLASSAAGGKSSLPAVGSILGEPVTLPGKSLVPVADRPGSSARDLLITRTASELQLRGGSQLDVLWREAVPEEQVLILLSLTDEQVLLLNLSTMQILGRDARTGKELWPAIALKDHFKAGPGAQVQVNEPADGAARRAMAERVIDLPAGMLRLQIEAGPGGNPIRMLQALEQLQRQQQRIAQAQPQPAEELFAGDHEDDGWPLIALSDSMLCVASQEGDVLGFHRSSGQLRWRQKIAGRQATHLDVNEDIAVLAALGPDESQIQSVILAMDTATGRALAPPIQVKEPVVFVTAEVEDLLLYGTHDELHAFQFSAGRPAWSMELVRGTRTLTPVARSDGELLLVQDSLGAVIAVDPAQQRIVGRTDDAVFASALAQGSTQALLAMESENQRWHLLTPLRAFMLAPDGKVQWRDAVAEAGPARLWSALTQDATVLLMFPSSQGRVVPTRPWQPGLRPAEVVHVPHEPTQQFTYRLCLLDHTTGRITLDRLIGPLNEQLLPQHCQVLSDRIVLSTGSRTVVIPARAR